MLSGTEINEFNYSLILYMHRYCFAYTIILYNVGFSPMRVKAIDISVANFQNFSSFFFQSEDGYLFSGYGREGRRGEEQRGRKRNVSFIIYTKD